MHTLIIEPGNPHDLTEDDEQQLHHVIAAADADVDARVVRRPEKGYGVTLSEVLHVFVENPEIVVTAAQSIRALVDWARERWRKDGRRRSVILYGPDGEPLKTIEVGGSDGEPVEASGGDCPPRLPPPSTLE